MKLYTTVKKLKEKDACYNEEQWEEFMSKMCLTSEYQSFDIVSGLKHAGIYDCIWALCTQDNKDTVAFFISIADIALHVYKEKYPFDRKIQRCISLMYKYAVGLCSKDTLKNAADIIHDTIIHTHDIYTDIDYILARRIIYIAYTTIIPIHNSIYEYTNYTTYIDSICDIYNSINPTALLSKTNMWKKVKELFIEHFSE